MNLGFDQWLLCHKKEDIMYLLMEIYNITYEIFLPKKRINLTLTKLIDSTSLYEIQGQEELVKDTLVMQ